MQKKKLKQTEKRYYRAVLKEEKTSWGKTAQLEKDCEGKNAQDPRTSPALSQGGHLSQQKTT